MVASFHEIQFAQLSLSLSVTFATVETTIFVWICYFLWFPWLRMTSSFVSPLPIWPIPLSHHLCLFFPFQIGRLFFSRLWDYSRPYSSFLLSSYYLISWYHYCEYSSQLYTSWWMIFFWVQILNYCLLTEYFLLKIFSEILPEPHIGYWNKQSLSEMSGIYPCPPEVYDLVWETEFWVGHNESGWYLLSPELGGHGAKPLM